MCGTSSSAAKPLLGSLEVGQVERLDLAPLMRIFLLSESIKELSSEGVVSEVDFGAG